MPRFRLQVAWIIPPLLALLAASQGLAQTTPTPSAPSTAPPATSSAQPAASSPPPEATPPPPADSAAPPVDSAAPPPEPAPAPSPPATSATPPKPIPAEPPPRTQFQVQSDARAALRYPGYVVGAVVHGGGGLYTSSLGAGSPLVTGYRFSERGGIISGLLIGGIVTLLGASLAAMPDSVNVQSNTYTRTNASGQTEVVREETRTATYSNGEGRQALMDGSQDAAKGLIAYRQQSFELDIYTRDWFGSDLGDARGYRANFLFTLYTGKHLIFEGGFGFGSVSAIVPGKDVLVDEEYIGLPLRLIFPWGPLYAQAAWDVNLAWIDSDFLSADENEYETRTVDGRGMRVDPVRPSPFSLSVHAVLWRLTASVGVETARPWKGQFGYVATLGARF